MSSGTRSRQLQLENLAVGSDDRNRCILQRVPGSDFPQPTQQYQIYFWPEHLAAVPD